MSAEGDAIDATPQESTEEEDLLLLAQMQVARKQHEGARLASEGRVQGASAAAADAPGPVSQQQLDDDQEEDQYEDQEHEDAADALASKFMRSSKANKAGRRKARTAAATAAAAPAGPALTGGGNSHADAAVAGPSTSQEAKHERKVKQQQEKVLKASGYGVNSSTGIAQGEMSVAEQEMVKHALTQMSYLKQVAPHTYQIEKGKCRACSVTWLRGQ